MQVKGIPFLVFDVGGVLEMFDQNINPEAVVWEPTIDALYAKLHSELPDLNSCCACSSDTGGTNADFQLSEA